MAADTSVDARRVLHVLQVTDCHLFPSPDASLLGVNTCASLAAVLEAACRERTPDAVLATGDIAQDPAAATYRLFLSTLRSYYAGPLLCVPGNHDHGETFRAELPCADLSVGAWRVAGVDTHVDDVVGGSVDEQELARLQAALVGHGPTLVVGHHCPAEIGCAWLDVHRIDNGEALLDVIDTPEVKAYAFGHIHQEVDQRAGTRLLGTPSTCFQFASDTVAFAIDDAKPGYRWLDLANDGTFSTEVARIGDFPLTINLRDRGHR